MILLKKKNFVYSVVALISLLLLADILLTYYNTSIIHKNRQLQRETETIKLFTEQIGKSTIHGIDIGIRGYAIIQEERFFSPVDSAYLRKDSILSNIESRLRHQRYPKISEFMALQDSLSQYFTYCFHLRDLIQQKRMEEFYKLFLSDRGLSLWLQYLQCQKNIAAFEDRINEDAQEQYNAALRGNQILQIVLFLICVPTLLYTAYYTRQNFQLSDLLRHAEVDKNKMLIGQNQELERMVTTRTSELLAQNQKLQTAQQIIEEQNQQIQIKNSQLEMDVDTRTQELQNANEELIQQNTQLEQFAFIAAHNLRAPLTRILGLANILELHDEQEDKTAVISKMVGATRDMDTVISDLNTILDIRKHTSNLTEVNLHHALLLANKTLERQYDETRAVIQSDFRAADTVVAVPAYIDSILYNLLSNAIKYRDPERAPDIVIRTFITDQYTCLHIRDNGLGIDLARNKGNVFGLYKRFHLHTEGRGIGLYLIKTQMTALGGKVEIESEPGKGTSFFLYFKQ